MTVANLKKQKSNTRTLFGYLMTGVSGVCLLATVVPLFAVLIFVAIQGFRSINLNFFIKLPPAPGLAGGGVGNAVIGTLIVVAIATLIALPIGVLTAVYLSEFSDGNQVARAVSFATNLLSGIPSIVAGVFAYGALVASGLLGFSALAGGVALAVLMLPTIIRTTDEALKIVPQDIRWAALGVGAYRYQTVLFVVLPAALPSIITGVTLAIARAAGETAPLIFTALYSNFWPRGIKEPIATLAVLVYNFSAVPYKSQQELAWAASLLLIFLVLITNITARFFTRKKIY
jgi:phosphate transport system permease protein